MKALVFISILLNVTMLVVAADSYSAARESMVALLKASIPGRTPIHDERVLQAMLKVPRHALVPESVRKNAYADSPLPIGNGQTISQPYIVAHMTQAAGIEATDTVLEIGTGSGYQAAVLAELAKQVYTIEIVEPLGVQARQALESLGYENIQFRIGDGYKGWPETAPFDAILVTAAPDHIPQPLLDQLKPGGRMVIPVGPTHSVQHLKLITKDASGEIQETLLEAVRFVPLTREPRQ
jgi:protein-L-isoaspartate(D-aspartate) O-methyltransferase